MASAEAKAAFQRQAAQTLWAQAPEHLLTLLRPRAFLGLVPQVQFLKLLIRQAQQDDVNLLLPSEGFSVWLQDSLFLAKRAGARVSRNTAHWRFDMMQGLYASLLQLGWLNQHPMDGMSPIRYVAPKPRSQVAPLSPTELAHIFEALRFPSLQVVFLLAYELQWRGLEIRALRWQDVNLVEATVKHRAVSDRLLRALQAAAPDGFPLFQAGTGQHPVVPYRITAEFSDVLRGVARTLGCGDLTFRSLVIAGRRDYEWGLYHRNGSVEDLRSRGMVRPRLFHLVWTRNEGWRWWNRSQWERR